MSEALKPKRIDSEEEDEDHIEYIEVKASSQIKAILKAEKEGSKQSQSLPIQSSTHSPVSNLTQEKPKQRKFIKDDRQRQYPQREHSKQQPEVSESIRKDKPAKHIKEQSTKPKKEEVTKQKVENRPPKKERDEFEKKQKKERSSQDEKRIVYVQKNQRKDQQHKKVKYSQKNHKEVRYQYKTRKQVEVKNGEQVELELVNKLEEYENQIYVGDKKSVEDYLTLAKKLLKKYDFIILKAFGGLVSKAFLIAGQLAQDLPNLKQINIPSTVKAKESRKDQEDRIRTRGSISIEVSIHALEKNHIGYQQAKPQKEIQKESDGDRPKNKYREKEERDYRKEEKPHKDNRYREKESKYREIDERQLR